VKLIQAGKHSCLTVERSEKYAFMYKIQRLLSAIFTNLVSGRQVTFSQLSIITINTMQEFSFLP